VDERRHDLYHVRRIAAPGSGRFLLGGARATSMRRSIGIEIVNPGHEFGYAPIPDAQIEAVIQLARELFSRHPIPPERVARPFRRRRCAENKTPASCSPGRAGFGRHRPRPPPRKERLKVSFETGCAHSVRLAPTWTCRPQPSSKHSSAINRPARIDASRQGLRSDPRRVLHEIDFQG